LSIFGRRQEKRERRRTCLLPTLAHAQVWIR
jgi:hypothetical protein